MLSVRPKISILSGGEAGLSLRDEAVVDRDLERDSRRRLLFDSRDLERFLLRSVSRDLDLERLRLLLCLLLFECLERDELRLLDRPMAAGEKAQHTANPNTIQNRTSANTFKVPCTTCNVRWRQRCEMHLKICLIHPNPCDLTVVLVKFSQDGGYNSFPRMLCARALSYFSGYLRKLVVLHEQVWDSHKM